MSEEDAPSEEEDDSLEEETVEETVSDSPIVEEESTDEESEEIVQNQFTAPLPDDKFSRFETYSTYILVGVISLLLLGSLLIPSVFWEGLLKPTVWDPITQDAVEGDAGYNSFNTLLFTSLLLLFAVVLSAYFRKARFPADANVIIAFVPWVVLASVLRVLEDSELFPESYQILFISPLIHLHLAFWVIVTAALGHWAERLPTDKGETTAVGGRQRLVAIILLLFMWLLLFSPALAADESIGMFWPVIGLISAILVASWLAKDEASSGMECSLLAVGSGAVVLSISLWLQFQFTPWHAGNDPTWWPAFVILGVPTILCWQLYRMGSEANARMIAKGYDSGVIPSQISLEEWEKGNPVEKEEYELDARMALLASPLVLTFAFGQLCDGLATWVGIDFFGYSEKHVVSAEVIEWGAALTGGAGAWLFFVTKLLLTGALVWLFTQIRIEYRHRHLRLLVVLALLIVGLAPGLRDLGRLVLGV